MFHRNALCRLSQTSPSCLYWGSHVKSFPSSNQAKLFLNCVTSSGSYASSGSTPNSTTQVRGLVASSARYLHSHQLSFIDLQYYALRLTSRTCTKKIKSLKSNQINRCTASRSLHRGICRPTWTDTLSLWDGSSALHLGYCRFLNCSDEVSSPLKPVPTYFLITNCLTLTQLDCSTGTEKSV